MALYPTSADFPAGTPLHHFLAWNEARRRRDRRDVIARDLYRLLRHFGDDAEAIEGCVAHLVQAPVIAWRWCGWMRLCPVGPGKAPEGTAAQAARLLVEALRGALGTGAPAAHAAVFQAFEALAAEIDLGDLARIRPRIQRAKPHAAPRRILVIKLSALGDFIQALGPAAALRRHHE